MKEVFYTEWWDNYPTSMVNDTPHENPEVGSEKPHLIFKGFPFN